MCFGGSPRTPSAPPPPPPPAPAPVVTPSEVGPQSANDARKKNLNQLRYGLASTIKTGARGITGAGAELQSAGLTGRNRLGA